MQSALQKRSRLSDNLMRLLELSQYVEPHFGITRLSSLSN